MLGWLFGGTDAANKTISSISSGIDKLVYTPEEKADASREGVKLWIEYQKATQPQNLSRRLIALVIVAVWALTVIAAGILGVTSAFDNPNAGTAASFLLDLLFKAIMPSVVVIVSFYFYKRIAE